MVRVHPAQPFVSIRFLVIDKLFVSVYHSSMKKTQFAKWLKDTEIANDGKIIAIGCQVIDPEGHRGIVVAVEEGHDIEDHGRIAVWQMDRLEYGPDNCEHYPHYGWERILQIQIERALSK